MKRRNAYIALLILVAAVTITAFFYFYSRPAETVELQSLSFESRELTPAAFDAAVKEFTEIINNQNPRIALEELRKQINSDNATLRSCHDLVHEIGHQAYKKYADFGEAMQYRDEICNSGYLHGVIEAHFATSTDVFKAMHTVCSPYPAGKFLSWECFHGIGHGAMFYTSNNLPQSLKMCESLNSSFAVSSCVNGVFMENFATDQGIHASEYLDSENIFYPCADMVQKYKNDCYLYAPTHYLNSNNNDYIGALKWCRDAEYLYRETCAQGVGGQAIKENIADPKLVETVCLTEKASARDSCIGGMVGLYINHFGSLEPAYKLCELLLDSNKRTCYLIIQLSSTLF
jgi:hypothetical protein